MLNRLLCYSVSIPLIISGFSIVNDASKAKSIVPDQGLNVVQSQGIVPIEKQSNGYGLILGGGLLIGGVASILYGEFGVNNKKSNQESNQGKKYETKSYSSNEPVTTRISDRDYVRSINDSNDVLIPELPSAVESKPHPEMIAAKDDDLDPMIYDLLDEGCVWLIGRKGSGKSSKAEWFVEKYLDFGYEVWIIDPHCKAGQWQHPNIKVYGRGMNYREVDKGLGDYEAEMTRRYKKRSTTPGYEPIRDEKRIIILCEEMSKWGSKVNQEIMSSFMGCVLADIRKANGGALFISHGETLNMFGGKKALEGFRDAIDADMAKLYSDSEPVPGSRPTQYKPTGKGSVKFPGDDKARPIKIGSSMIGSGKHFKVMSQLEKQTMTTVEEQKPDPLMAEFSRVIKEGNYIKDNELDDPW